MAPPTHPRSSVCHTVAYDLRMVAAGGVGTYALELLRHMLRDPKAAGFAFLGLRRSEDPFLEELPELCDLTWSIVNGTPWTLRGALAAGLVARRRSADLYHATHVTIPVGFDGPLVTTVHDLIPLLAPESMPSPAARAAFRATVRQAIRRSETVLAVSRFTAETLLAHGFRAQRLIVTPEGVDDRFAPPPPRVVADVKERYGLPDSYVLWLGGFKPYKNILALLDAHTRLPADVRRAHPLVLAGDANTPHGHAVRSRIGNDPSAGGRLGQVRLPGRLDAADLPGLYGGAAVFAFPSVIEGFGLPVLEAAACGVPVVASSAGPLPELMDGSALYFDPHDAEDIASRLRTLLGDADLRRDLARRGRERARRFTWARTAAETLRAYRLALQVGPRLRATIRRESVAD